jgi:DNA-directed RNA polymerase subunit N (RpoN/RPB10)
LKKRIQDNEIEEEVLDDLMKKAQKDYFSKGTITKSTYEIKIVQYKKRIAEIKRENPVLEAKLQKISKIKWKQEEK